MANTGKILFLGTHKNENPQELYNGFLKWAEEKYPEILKNIHWNICTENPTLLGINCDRLTERIAQEFWDYRYANKLPKVFEHIKAFVCDCTWSSGWIELTHHNMTKGWDNYKPGDTMG